MCVCMCVWVSVYVNIYICIGVGILQKYRSQTIYFSEVKCGDVYSWGYINVYGYKYVYANRAHIHARRYGLTRRYTK